ncbi:hypothetical protein BPAE_0080g00230 [Botrytis paeoniae]|uniref:Uncharacterized protein n=1 Tax=Botrytis paeoniae TaxID=278948 RepID=A0A4Z1FRB6_9HELO|nr:hypothetical protein BPAE_0080g00230 [Botrytis paeoniae]
MSWTMDPGKVTTTIGHGISSLVGNFRSSKAFDVTSLMILPLTVDESNVSNSDVKLFHVLPCVIEISRMSRKFLGMSKCGVGSVK